MLKRRVRLYLLPPTKKGAVPYESAALTDCEKQAGARSNLLLWPAPRGRGTDTFGLLKIRNMEYYKIKLYWNQLNWVIVSLLIKRFMIHYPSLPTQCLFALFRLSPNTTCLLDINTRFRALFNLPTLRSICTGVQLRQTFALRRIWSRWCAPCKTEQTL